MGVYFFTLHECSGRITEDPVGHEARDEEHARRIAIDKARGIMAHEISQGRLCLSCWLVIKDRKGHEIMTLHFGDAVQMIDARGCPSEEQPGRAGG